MPHDGLQSSHILQIKNIACVILRDQQHTMGIRADSLNCRHHRLDTERHKIWIEIIESTREQIGIHRRQFETTVAKIYRTIKRHSMLLPLSTQPMLNNRHRIKDAPF